MSYRFIVTREDGATSPSFVSAEVQVHEHADLGELVDCFKQFCLAAGYAPSNVEEIFYGYDPREFEKSNDDN